MEKLFARDVMTTGYAAVSPKASIIEAARLMLERHVSGLPVIGDNGQLVGFISEGDLLRRAEIETAGVPEEPVDKVVLQQFRKAYGGHVADVMTSPVASVLVNTPLAEIARLLQLMRLKCVPVTEGGRTVGVISRADILRVLVNTADRPDAERGEPQPIAALEPGRVPA